MRGADPLWTRRCRARLAALVVVGAACALVALTACVPAKIYIQNDTPRDVLVASAETPSKWVSVPSETTRAIEVNRKDRDFLVYLVSSPDGKMLGCIYVTLYGHEHSENVILPLAYMEPCVPQPPPDRTEPEVPAFPFGG